MTLRNKTFLTMVLVLVGIMLVPAIGLAQSDSIGTVNLQVVFDNHPGLPGAQQDFQNSVADLQDELQQLDEEAQQQALPDYQQRVQEMEMEIQETLMIDIESAIQDVAEDLNLEVVVEENAVLFGGVDVTEEVIEALAAIL